MTRGAAAMQLGSTKMQAGISAAAKHSPQRFAAMKKVGELATIAGAQSPAEFRNLAQDVVCQLGRENGNKGRRSLERESLCMAG